MHKMVPSYNGFQESAIPIIQPTMSLISVSVGSLCAFAQLVLTPVSLVASREPISLWPFLSLFYHHSVWRKR